MRRLPLALVPLLLIVAASVRADEPNVCDQPHTVDNYQLLRRLSLDVRGRIPSIEEYEALDQSGATPYDHLAEWVKTDAFRLAMRRYHEEMLWPNVSTVKLVSTASQLVQKASEPALHLTSAGRAKTWRGDADTMCGDFEETRFDSNYPGQHRVDVSKLTPDTNGVRQEGWRLVKPYWDPTTQVKVCAFDAQETPTTVKGGKTLDCGNPTAHSDAACGCGTDLRWCYGPGTTTTILGDLREQLGRAVDEVTTGGKAYTDLLLSTSGWETGRIAYWKKWISVNVSINGAFVLSDLTETVPDKAFTDTAWTKVERGATHAGVTTLPAYLLRFQTNRGRANRFRINFLCEQFVPPSQLSDEPPSCQLQGTDLQQRCNCRYCHSVLEPMAAHWATFSEAGTTLQKDNPLFPLTNPSCVKATPSATCSRFYVTQADAHNAGSLLAYQYADTYPQVQTNIDGGPRALAQSIIDSGEFASCAVKRAFFQFMRRDMRVSGTQTDELDLLNQLVDGFKTSGYSFPLLVQQIVKLPTYAEAR